MSKQRCVEISFLNVLYCVLVVFIHLTSEPVTYLIKNSVPYFCVLIPWRLSAFVVQGFIFLSGVKLILNLRQPMNYPLFIYKRFKTVYLPYVLWASIYYCFFVSIGYFPFRFSDLAGYIARGDISSQFYFVIIIAQFYLLAPLFVKLIYKVKPKILLPVSLAATLFLWFALAPILNKTGICSNFIYTDRVFTTYLIYFVFGCFAGRYYDKFTAWVKKYGGLISALFVIMSFADIALYLKINTVGVIVSESFHLFYCICAIMFTFYISLSAKKLTGGKLPRLVAVADRATYHVYLCHCLLIVWLNDKLYQAGVTGYAKRYLLRIIIVYSACFGLCMLWNIVKDKLKRLEQTEIK